MKLKFLLPIFFIGIQSVMAQVKVTENTFIANPYLQIGRNPSATSLELLWHAADVNADWAVELKDKGPWQKTPSPTFNRVAVAGVDAHRVYRVTLSGLTPGSTFEYRVLKNGTEVFSTKGKAPKSENQNYRFVAIGDIGALTPDQKLLAVQIYKAKPDLVIVPGDIVYNTGLVSEYRTKFWNIYNSDKETDQSAPIMAQIPFVAAPGNHDLGSRDLDRLPQSLAYYMFWQQPLNGPASAEGNGFIPVLKGSEANKKAFAEAAGDAYPKMSNFSFNYGNAHWLFLDSNPYADFNNQQLTNWIKSDLASASSQGATWRFVVFHHPGFNSSKEHFQEQQARALSPIFESANVDVVITGHVHNYQRTFPLTFVPEKPVPGAVGHVVNGTWALDKNYDGKTNTKPKGIIYIVTGAGGADLYNPEQNDDPGSWQAFTDKFISNTHSLTTVDVDGKTLTFHQISTAGKEIDSYKVTK
jgi:Icc-related predicted phosphoesterase